MGRADRVIELNHTAIDCLVTISLIDSVMERYPEHVRDNFEDKVVRLTKYLRREMEEFVDFGESFDEEAGRHED